MLKLKYITSAYFVAISGTSIGKTIINKKIRHYNDIHDFIAISGYNCIKSPLFIPIGIVGCFAWTCALHATIWPALFGYPIPLKVVEEIPDKIKNWEP
jgi:hypothetical protein